MSVSALLTAALPIPITSFGLIPAFGQQKHFLAVYTSLYCFLLLAFIFFSRHSIAKLLFPNYFSAKANSLFSRSFSFTIAVLPAVFIVLSIFCVITYHSILDKNINQIRTDISKDSTLESNKSPIFKYYFSIDTPLVKVKRLDQEFILNETQVSALHSGSNYLIYYYLGIFIFAEMAFILMAMKEYLQDILGLTELNLILGQLKKQKSKIESS